MRPSNLGTTFSQLQCKYLKIDPIKTLNNILDLPFNTIRVCAYWDQIEKQKNQFDFFELDKIVNVINNSGKTIMLSVGIKSPRWPEFHVPQWLKSKYDLNRYGKSIDRFSEIAERAAKYTKKTIERYRDLENIRYFLIENEGLNNSNFTYGRHLSFAFINSQIWQARNLKRADQKIICSNAVELYPPWSGNDLNSMLQSLHLADAVGLNIYTKVPLSGHTYLTENFIFWWKVRAWYRKIQNAQREVWITESQAEPWEKVLPNQDPVHLEKLNYPSSDPKKAVALVSKLTNIGFQNILMWGAEYWFWHKENGRDQWWSTIQNF